MEKLVRVRESRITIPRAMRRKLDIQEGDYVLVKLEGNHLVVQPVDIVRKKA